MVEPLCTQCPFNVPDVPRVRGIQIGPEEPSNVTMIGMAPADEEVTKGEPFVGISGQILKAVYTQLGYFNPYLMNCLMCPIPDDAKDDDRLLAVECCKWRALEELKQSKPGLIIALGAMPLNMLAGNDYTIMKSSGRVIHTEDSLFKIAPILPSIHPAFVWRNPEAFYDFTEFMGTGVKWLEGDYQVALPAEYTVATRDNIQEILDLFNEASSNGQRGSLDLETTEDGFYPYGYSPNQIRCMVLSLDTKTSYIIPGFHCGRDNPYYVEGEIEYENLLSHPGLKEMVEKGIWRMHNGHFDASFLFTLGIFPHIQFDSMLAHYVGDERSYSHGLKRIAHTRLGADDWEADLRNFVKKKKDTYDKVPNSRLFFYAAHDGIYTNQISEDLEKEVEGSWVFNNILMPATNMFTDLRYKGIRIDPKELMNLDQTLEKELDAAEDELAQLCGEPVNPGSPKEVQDLLFETLGFKPHPRYRKSTRKQALEAFLPDPIVEKIIECRHLGKLKNTYVDGLARFVTADYRVHPQFNLMAAVTGRISTSDPATMNVVKRGGIMRVYICEPGHKMGIFDFKGAELRCGAIETGDEHLAEILMDPTRDPHGEIATFHFGAELAAAKRGTVKTVVFGRMYGRTIEAIMYALKITWDEAVLLVEVVDSFFPGLPLYRERIKYEIEHGGFLKSYFGRLRRFGLITRDNIRDILREGYNFPIQSMASDINLLCMIEIYRRRKEFGVTPLWPIHDAILMDIEDPSVVPDVKKVIEDYAFNLVEGKMKFPVDVKLGDNWGDATIWKEEGD